MRNQEQNAGREVLDSVFSNHPLYRLISGACTKYERELTLSDIRMEDFFVETANCLDEVKEKDKDPAFQEEICEGMWDSTWSRLSRKSQSISKDEIDLATCVVQTLLIVCLIFSEPHCYLVEILMRTAERNYSSRREEILSAVQKFMWRYGEDSLRAWVSDFMSVDNTSYLSEEIASALHGEDESVEEETSDGKYPPVKVRMKILGELLKECDLWTNNHDRTKVARLMSNIIGTSYNNALNNLNNGLILNENQHGKDIKNVNKVLDSLKSDLRIKC